MSTEHIVSVRTTGAVLSLAIVTLYRVECTCGWRSGIISADRDYLRDLAAELCDIAGRDHLADVIETVVGDIPQATHASPGSWRQLFGPDAP